MYILLGNKTLDAIVRRSQSLALQAKWAMTFLVIFFIPLNAFAFNEFQTYIEQKSKKQLNCAYCHNHVNGPEGNEPGQLGSLNDEQKQLTTYNQFLGANKELVDSPILNEFGNYLVKKLGYEEIINAQEEPNKLVDKLKDFDLDQDGIKDSEELLDGTLPNDPLDGNPFKLFKNNLKKKRIEICFQVVAIVLLIISLFKLKK